MDKTGLNDFERFKVLRVKQLRNRIIRAEAGKLCKEAARKAAADNKARQRLAEELAAFQAARLDALQQQRLVVAIPSSNGDSGFVSGQPT